MNFDDLRPCLHRLAMSGREPAVVADLTRILEMEDAIVTAAGITPRPEHGNLQYLLSVMLAGEHIPPQTNTELFGLFSILLVNCYEVFGVAGVLYSLSARYPASSWHRVASICNLPSRGHINVRPDWSKSTLSYLEN